MSCEKKLLCYTQNVHVHVPLKQQKLFTIEIVGMESSLHEKFQIYSKREIGSSSLQNTDMEITMSDMQRAISDLFPCSTAHWAHHIHNTNSHF